MKQLYILIALIFLSYAGFSQELSGEVLCPTKNVPADDCGCTTDCFNDGLCSPVGSGNCSTSSTTLTVNVPADRDVSISIAAPTCNTFAGLDASDFYQVNGRQQNGSSNTTPDYDGPCLATVGNSGSFDILINGNRAEECIVIDVSFTDNGGTAGAGCDIISVLPVEFSSFTAKVQKNTAILNWTTASEINNDYFEVEQSTNGQQFSSIGLVQGAGTTSIAQEYSFDAPMVAGADNYFRLKQVDYDGGTDYSSIIVLNGGSSSTTLDAITSYVSEDRRLHVLGATSSEFRILTMNGQQIMEGTLSSNGQNIIDISTLQRGMYILQSTSAKGNQTHKFVK